MKFLRRILFSALILTLVGVLSTAQPTFAQSSQDCQGHAEFGNNPLATPGTTATEAAAGGDSLRDFALDARDYLNSITTAEELGYAGCINRTEGDWKSGATYLAALTLDGRVFYNTNDMATGGRPLNRFLFGAILAGLGITGFTQEAIQTQLAEVARTGEFPTQNGGAFDAGGIFGFPGVTGYAVGYGTTIPYILLAGLDFQDSHFMADTLPPGDPSIRADQVTDRETLKQFVNEAKDYLLGLVRTNPTGAFGIARSILRRAPWKHENIYLFVMDTNGYTHLHGAFPDRFEFQNPSSTLADMETGELILPQIIAAAQSSPDGGYATYNFDDPNDPNDNFNTLKETYAVQVTETVDIPGVGPITSSFIIGAGIYGEGDSTGGPVAEDVCPRPAGLASNMYETPSVTAAQAAASSDNLPAFAQAAKAYFNSLASPQALAYAGCLIRNEGPWKAGSTYIVALTLDGRVLLNGQDMSTGGRPLQPAVYGAILAALGIDVANPATIPTQLGQVFTDRAFPNANGGALPMQIGGGYAVGYGTTIPYILLAGVDLQDQHFAPDTVDPGDPEVSADEVVDRDTLKRFVNGAIDHLLGIFNENPAGAIGIARSILRRPPWKHGPVYLFIMEDSGYTLLHGAFPDRFEFQTPTNTLREVLPDGTSGDLILPKIINAAKGGGDEGDFVQYYFDNPDDPNDDFNTLKTTFARALTFPIPGGQPVTYIVGAGIYGDGDEGVVSDESVAATKGWLARFGRAVGSQAVDMISSRLNSAAPSGAKMTLGGQTVKLDADPERYLTKEGAGFEFASFANKGVDLRSLSRARTANRLTNGEEDSTGAYREMTMSRLLSGASFHLASAKEAAEAAGSRWSIWGRGAQSSFEGGGEAAIEGDVTTAMLGVDFEKGKLLAGVALSRSSGDGGFQNDGRSELEATLTSVHPYLRYEASERLSLWGALGMGQGEMTLDDEQSGQKFETDIEMRMGAFGIRGALTKIGGFDLAVKSDVLLTQMDSDEKDGLEAISAESSRLRVMLEASRDIATEGGGTFRPSVEAGLRHDGGDVDEGLGVEVGGSLRFTNPGMGLTFEVNARGLITHEEEDVADWGVGGMIRIAPGKAGRGLALTVQPSVGETAGSAARLWGLKDASRLAKEEIEDLVDPRVRAEVGYGLDAWGGLLTPYAGLSVSESGSGTYRMGGRFRMGERLSMSLEGDVRERVNADPVHGVAVRGSLRW